MLRIQVLGPVTAWRDRDRLDLESTAQRAVLGLLAVAGGQVVPRITIMETLWPNRTPPVSAVNVIQTHVLRLRRRLEPDRPSRARSEFLVQIGDGYALRTTAAAIDLLQFRQLVASAEDTRLAGRSRQAAALLDEALGLWHGPPLVDIPALAGRYSCHDLLQAYAAEVARTVDTPEALHAARSRMIDHYLHTARAADRLLLPHREPPIVLGRAAPGTAPETPADRDEAMHWFTVEHRALVAVAAEAASRGFEAHAARLAWTLCTYFQWRGHWHDQSATQQVALRAAERLGDPAGQAHAHHHLARAYAKLSRPDDALEHYDRALKLFGGCGDHAGQGQTHLGLGAVFEQGGDSRTALRHAHLALELFRLAGNLPGQANAMNSAGWCHAQLGDHEQAIAACNDALALQQEIGDRDGEAATWDSLGYAHHRLDRFSEAVACYERAVEHRRALGDRYYESASLHRLGDTHLAAGDPSAAAQAWRAALSILDTLGHADAEQLRGKLGRCRGEEDDR